MPQSELFDAISVGSKSWLKAAIWRLDQKGEDINESDDWGTTPLAFAVFKGRESLVNLLLAHPDIDVNDYHEYSQDGCGTALEIAINHGHKSIVKRLLAHPDIDVNKTSDDIEANPYTAGSAALHLAAGKGDKPIVELLLSREDIDVNKSDVLGRTPLSYAIERGNKSIEDMIRNAATDNQP